MEINDKTLQALATAINFRKLRQQLISSNIANSETPGYKAKRVDFEQALQQALDVDGTNSIRTEDQRHFNVGGGGFQSLEPEVYEDTNGNVQEDGNNVDVEAEIAEQNENRIMHEAAVQLLNKQLAMKKYILNSEK